MKPRISMRALRLCLTAVIVALTVMVGRGTPTPANGKDFGPDGQIAFSRFDEPDTTVITVNPDGSHEQVLITKPPLATPNECPHWSPDGSRIATCGATNPPGATVIINPDDGSYRELPLPDPTLATACVVWSPNGKRLACELASAPADPNRNGIYTIRSSDGGGLTRMTSTRGHDVPGSYSPDGTRFVFGRLDESGDPVGLFVVNVNGAGLKQITPSGTILNDGVGGDWSPRGNEIVFSRRLTPAMHSALWVVHADGSGLREIKVRGVACGGAIADPKRIGCFAPRWSPDGKKIAFGIGSGKAMNIYTINADGSGLTQISHGGSAHDPDWGTHSITP